MAPPTAVKCSTPVGVNATQVLSRYRQTRVAWGVQEVRLTMGLTSAPQEPRGSGFRSRAAAVTRAAVRGVTRVFEIVGVVLKGISGQSNGYMERPKPDQEQATEYRP